MNSEIELIKPYGETLINLIVSGGEREELTAQANRLPSIQISNRAVCDLELLATGAFSPLETFNNKVDFETILQEMRLANGLIFPIPITLPVNDFDGLKLDKKIALRDAKNDLLAVMTVEEIYEWSRDDFARKILGTNDLFHPLVTEIEHWGKFNISGKLQVLNLPKHFDFKDLRLSPNETRNELIRLGNENVAAFQTRNPIHRAHEEMTKRAAEIIGGTLLLQPVVGMTKPNDVDYFTRVRVYRKLVENHYEKDKTLLSLLPLAMRMAGPREAIFHALIRRNYGANHFIVGRDHASPGIDSHGKSFYEPFAAQELFSQFETEIGVKMLAFGEMVYLPEEDRYEEINKIENGTKTVSLSGTQIREEFLYKGKSLPAWFTRKETAEILAESYPPRSKQGVCLWFTGLSGAGKSTTAEILTNLLHEKGRRVTLLDGDVVRTHLSKGLGFSKEDRDANILRIGFVASEIVRHGGIAICAAVSPYRAARNEVRNLVGKNNFIEIFVDTPLEICERRDTKGMYAKARRGEIKDFTGIDDVYEMPENAEITLDTVNIPVEENAAEILRFLSEYGFVAS
ncbi:MAG TPA: bifunctional sulfate adenylyltransferase/adenylylsulfate kinase [Pyrinomonadaceae bacterium]|nr:bifunctional sulfate adenylyltransferase/adenylylsulfate kinase [Pyrinomonadaceae bacterium]